MALYVAQIWSANQPPYFNDFYAPWWAAHELLLHGRNPYSPAVAHEIQSVIYGAPANSTSPADPANIAGGFAYPPYAALILWPTVGMSFAAAQKVFSAISLVAILVSLILWLRVLRYRFSPLRWLTVALFTLGSFPALQGMKLGNLSVIAAAFVAATLFLLAENHFVIAGIFLALSSFKPQFIIGLLLWLAIWIASDWRRRRPLAWSFLSTLLLLVLVSEWLVPGWIRQFFNVVRAYRQYTYGHSLLDVWFTPGLGWLVASVFLVAALALGWRHRSQPANSLQFFIVASLALAVTLLVIPTLAPHAQLLLLPGFLCVLEGQTWLSKSSSRLVLMAAWALLAWPWVAAFALLLVRQWVPLSTLLRFWAVPLYTSPLLPLALAAALALLTRELSSRNLTTRFRPAPVLENAKHKP
ncbi:MAG TPA: glycosyltransferase family 87 protein [Candidatus Sulfotelmatobacter sp.]|nr:glycosyltransferase family 87 protein [Candidatus Sulfotelmatobacter sp.]